MRKPRTLKPVSFRLFTRTVILESGCIEWTGYRGRLGYGQMYADGRLQPTHRIAWQLAHGAIPEGQFVCHKCDNPPCVNVEHLFLGAPRDNSTDRDRKGRTNNGQARKTHCKHGHAFDAENTYYYLDGRGRQCKECVRLRTRGYRHVKAFLAEDAAKLRAFIGEGNQGLRIAK